MKFTKEEFLSNLEEGQNELLSVLADDPEVDANRFFKVARALELISLYGSVIYSIISPDINDESNQKISDW